MNPTCYYHYDEMMTIHPLDSEWHLADRKCRYDCLVLDEIQVYLCRQRKNFQIIWYKNRTLCVVAITLSYNHIYGILLRWCKSRKFEKRDKVVMHVISSAPYQVVMGRVFEIRLWIRFKKLVEQGFSFFFRKKLTTDPQW